MTFFRFSHADAKETGIVEISLKRFTSFRRHRLRVPLGKALEGKASHAKDLAESGPAIAAQRAADQPCRGIHPLLQADGLVVQFFVEGAPQADAQLREKARRRVDHAGQTERDQAKKVRV